MPFQRRRRVVVRVYQPELQWPMYGATSARTQAHPAIRVRPPFRVVWSRGLGSLIEFPAVVSDGVAYIGNNHGTVYALSMRDGTRALAARRPPREDGRLARGRRRRRSSSTGWTASCACSTARTGRLRFARPRRLADRVVADRPRPDRLLRRLERQRLRARPAHAAVPLGLPRRLRRSPPAPRSPAARSTSATTAAGCSRSRRGAARLRWSAGVNGRIYGTPAVWGGRVFVPSSDGGSLTAFTTGGRYALAGPHRQLRLLVAGRVGRPRLLRLVQRAPLLRLGLERPRRLDGADRRAGLGRAGGRRRRRLRGELRPPDRRRRRPHAAACCSASRTASTSRSREAAAGCSCTATRGSTRSSPPSVRSPLPWTRLGRHAPRSRRSRRRSRPLPRRPRRGLGRASRRPLRSSSKG